MTNTMVAIYARSGLRLAVFPMTQSLGISSNAPLGDPQIAWDQTSGRWIATAMDLGVNATEVSISNTSDPRGGWFNYSFQLPGAWEEVVGVSREDADVLSICVHVQTRVYCDIPRRMLMFGTTPTPSDAYPGVVHTWPVVNKMDGGTRFRTPSGPARRGSTCFACWQPAVSRRSFG